MFKIDNQQGPTTQHMELCSILCGSLDGRGVWRKTDTCICVCLSPFTVWNSQHCNQLYLQYKMTTLKQNHWMWLLHWEKQGWGCWRVWICSGDDDAFWNLGVARHGNQYFFFNWSIVDLQCCDNPCCVAKWLSCAHIYFLFKHSLLLWFIE